LRSRITALAALAACSSISPFPAVAATTHNGQRVPHEFGTFQKKGTAATIAARIGLGRVAATIAGFAVSGTFYATFKNVGFSRFAISIGPQWYGGISRPTGRFNILTVVTPDKYIKMVRHDVALLMGYDVCFFPLI
jgi:hypothetical protein